VELQIEGRTLRLLLDTGAKDILLYQQNLKASIPGKWLPTTRRIYHLAGKEELTQMVCLHSVQFGQNRWERLKMFLVDRPIDCCRQFDGILGLPSLELSRVHFDFRLHQVSWEP